MHEYSPKHLRMGRAGLNQDKETEEEENEYGKKQGEHKKWSFDSLSVQSHFVAFSRRHVSASLVNDDHPVLAWNGFNFTF